MHLDKDSMSGLLAGLGAIIAIVSLAVLIFIVAQISAAHNTTVNQVRMVTQQVQANGRTLTAEAKELAVIRAELDAICRVMPGCILPSQ